MRLVVVPLRRIPPRVCQILRRMAKRQQRPPMMARRDAMNRQVPRSRGRSPLRQTRYRSRPARNHQFRPTRPLKDCCGHRVFPPFYFPIGHSPPLFYRNLARKFRSANESSPGLRVLIKQSSRSLERQLQFLKKEPPCLHSASTLHRKPGALRLPSSRPTPSSLPSSPPRWPSPHDSSPKWPPRHSPKLQSQNPAPLLHSLVTKGFCRSSTASPTAPPPAISSASAPWASRPGSTSN